MPTIPVLFLEPSLHVGGAERVLANIVTRLDRDLFYPVVCCLKEPGPIGMELIERRIPVYHQLLSSRYSVGVLPALARLMRKERIQIVHTTNQPLTTFWGVAAGLLAGRPGQVTSVHSTRSNYHNGRGRLVNRVVSSRIDAVVALASAHREYLVNEQGMDPGKIHVIPNGIDLSRFRGPTHLRRSDLGLPDGEPVVGMLAALRPEKAHDTFLRAAARVLERIPTTHFVIIGDGPERRRLEVLAHSLGIPRQVHFLGRRDDVEQVLPLINVSVLSSRNTETFPLAILESMAASRPVVVTDVGSLREMVTSGENGLIVPPEDVLALASAVCTLLSDNDLATRMGVAGHERVQQFDVRHMVHAFETLFYGLVARERVRRPAAAKRPTASADRK